MRTHQLAAKPNRYSNGICSETVLVHNGFRFGVAGHTKDQQFYQDGVLVSGPSAIVYGLCVVLSDGGEGTDFSKDVPVQAGDVVVFDGQRYTVKVLGREHIELVPVVTLAGTTEASDAEAEDSTPTAGGYDRGEPGYFRALAQQTTDAEERELLLQDARDEEYRRSQW